MDDFDWVRFAVQTAFTIAAIHFGRWSQRRDDRKRAERAQARRLAVMLAEQTRRDRHRGA